MSELLGQDTMILVVEYVIFCAIFTIGVFLQVKVITALKRDQDQAWEMKLAHSVVQIAHWSLTLFLMSIHYIQPTFYDFFGTWFCYLLAFLRWFGSFEILFHSLYISIHKYIFIVHSETVTRIGKQKIKVVNVEVWNLRGHYYILFHEKNMKWNDNKFGLCSLCLALAKYY